MTDAAIGFRRGQTASSAAAWLAAGAGRTVAAAALSLALTGCGQSQEAKVLAALKAKFPDQRQCYGISQNEVGIHVSLPFGGTLFYPATGPTAPTRHLFVFYAAPAAEPVPELVGMLTKKGVLKKEQVQASIDVETTGLGPQTISKAGWFTHGTWQHHALTTFPVDIYVTARHDPRFLYDVHTSLQNLAYSPGTFPSRTFPDPLPPDGTHYVIPTVTPYALSVVTSACAAETPTDVEDVKTVHNWIGQSAVQATVTFGEDVAPWMATPAFSRAAPGPRQTAIGAPRKAVILFSEGDDGTLTYREERQP